MSTSRRPPSSQPSRRPSSSLTAVVVAVVVVLCIGAVVAIAVAMNGTDDSSAAGTDTSPPTTSESGCAEAPAAPGEPEQFDAPPDASLAESTTWTATVTTNCGEIILELDGAKAPQTVSSFLFLADADYFDNSPCHRLTTSGIFVLQCGDPTGSGGGGPGYGYGIENAPPDGAYPTGTLAMARTDDPNSNGSQFFIVYKDTALPTDGGGYSIFGEVTDGLDIISAIAKQGVAGGGGDGAPAQPISILDVSVTKT